MPFCNFETFESKVVKTHDFHVPFEYLSYLREIDVVKKNFLVLIVLKSDFDACGCAVVRLCGCAEFRRVAVVGIRRDIGIFQSGLRRMEGVRHPSS